MKRRMKRQKKQQLDEIEPVAGSRKTVAKRYGVSVREIDRKLSSREMHAYKVGRKTLIKFSDAEAALFAIAK